MTREQAIEEATRIASSIPVTKESPPITIPVRDEDAAICWTVTFEPDEYSRMDERGYWMDWLRWAFKSVVESPLK